MAGEYGEYGSYGGGGMMSRGMGGYGRPEVSLGAQYNAYAGTLGSLEPNQQQLAQYENARAREDATDAQERMQRQRLDYQYAENLEGQVQREKEMGLESGYKLKQIGAEGDQRMKLQDLLGTQKMQEMKAQEDAQNWRWMTPQGTNQKYGLQMQKNTDASGNVTESPVVWNQQTGQLMNGGVNGNANGIGSNAFNLSKIDHTNPAHMDWLYNLYKQGTPQEQQTMMRSMNAQIAAGTLSPDFSIAFHKLHNAAQVNASPAQQSMQTSAPTFTTGGDSALGSTVTPQQSLADVRGTTLAGYGLSQPSTPEQSPQRSIEGYARRAMPSQPYSPPGALAMSPEQRAYSAHYGNPAAQDSDFNTASTVGASLASPVPQRTSSPVAQYGEPLVRPIPQRGETQIRPIPSLGTTNSFSTKLRSYESPQQ